MKMRRTRMFIIKVLNKIVIEIMKLGLIKKSTAIIWMTNIAHVFGKK